MGLLAVTLTSNGVIIGALSAVAAAALAGLATRIDSGVEERRKQAIKLVSKLNELDLNVLSGVVTSYAVGDYSGIVTSVKHLYEEIETPEKLLDLLRSSFNKQLVKRLENPDEAAAIIAAVRPYLPPEKAAATSPPTVEA